MRNVGRYSSSNLHLEDSLDIDSELNIDGELDINDELVTNIELEVSSRSTARNNILPLLLNVIDVRKFPKKIISFLMFFNLIALTSGRNSDYGTDVYDTRNPLNRMLCSLLSMNSELIDSQPWPVRALYVLRLKSKYPFVKDRIRYIIDNTDPSLWLRDLNELLMDCVVKLTSRADFNGIKSMITNSSDYSLCPDIHPYLAKMDMILKSRTTTIRPTVSSTTTSTYPAITTDDTSVVTTVSSTVLSTIKSTIDAINSTVVTNTTGAFTAIDSTVAADATSVVSTINSTVLSTTSSTVATIDNTGATSVITKPAVNNTTAIAPDPTDPIFSTNNILLLVTCFLLIFSLILLIVFFRSNNEAIVRTRSALCSRVRRLFGGRDLSSRFPVEPTNRGAEIIEMVDIREAAAMRCLLSDELTQVFVEEECLTFDYDSDFDDESQDDNEPLYVNLEHLRAQVHAVNDDGLSLDSNVEHLSDVICSSAGDNGLALDDSDGERPSEVDSSSDSDDEDLDGEDGEGILTKVLVYLMVATDRL